MEKISLAIVTEDREYGRALGMALLNICGSLLIRIYNWNELISERTEYYGNDSDGVYSSRFDIILWDGEEAESVYGDKIVLLTENPAKAVRNYREQRFSLYKYTSARTMICALFDIYSFLTGRRAVNLSGHGVRLFTFSSCAGGTGCTSLALATGQELCRFRGLRVLYVSFEEIESTAEYMSAPSGIKGTGVYLYHLFREKDGYPFLDSYIINDDYGIEAFAPTGGRNPLMNLSHEEFDVFMSSLIECGRYDVIIMDTGDQLTETALSCMDISEKICFVSRTEASPREIQYLQHLICCCGEAVIDRMIKVENKVSEADGRVMKTASESSMLDTSVRVAEFKEIQFCRNSKRIILEDRFGEDIKFLTEKLMEPESQEAMYKKE
ncbi:MAG: hypothetical protein Q4C46_03605 [Bacillota bacterium]|nr:hypothetical protein [Bacillota bacterium]